MTEKPKGKSRNSTMRVYLFFLLMVLAHLAIGRGIWNTGRSTALDDLGMDGYRVMIDRTLEPGDGRCTVQVWRDGSWVEVAR